MQYRAACARFAKTVLGFTACAVLLWSVSGALAQAPDQTDQPNRPVYVRVVQSVWDWVVNAVAAAWNWIADAFERFMALFSGPDVGVVPVEATGPQVLGESTLSEDIPLAQPPPLDAVESQVILPELSPEPVSEAVSEPEPEAVAESVSEEAPEAAPVARGEVVDETVLEAAPEGPVQDPELSTGEPEEEPVEKKQSSGAIFIHAPDNVPPQSSATALAATTTTEDFTVEWEGQDNLRGNITLRFDVQYQVDSGDWTSWLSETVLMSSLFTGEDEKTYGFRTRSRDPEGNWEEYPTDADTSTYLNLSVPSDPIVTSHATSTPETVTGDDDEDAGVADVQVTLSGTGDSSDTLVISLTETSTTATTTINSLGNWSQQFTLAEGANSFTLRSSEADGDVSNTVNFSLTLELEPTLDVVINEIAWMGTAAAANDEWLELYNASSTAISLAGWTLSAADGTPSISLSGTIAAKGYFVLERTASTTISDVSENLIYTGALVNTGELLSLRNSASTLIDRVGSSTADWFAGDNDTKKTMERKDPAASGTDSSNWASNDETLVNGKDANGTNLKATPGSLNSVNTTIPRTITNLTFQYIYTTATSVKLYWTAPKTANLATTTPATYDVRYSSSAITDSNFSEALPLSGEPTPSVTQGTVQTFTASGLATSTTYYFAAKTNNGLEDSLVSNTKDITTASGNYASLASTYTDNTTIASSTGPYLVQNNITINAGVTVRIEPGTVIKMNTDGTSTGCDDSVNVCTITVNGTLVLGSATDSINGVVITSRDDDTYAGAHATSDGTPAAGDWGTISAGAGTSSLDFDNAIIRYGGLSAAMITVTSGATADIANSILAYSNNNILSLASDATSLTLANSTVLGGAGLPTPAGLDGIGVSSRANLSVTGTTFTGNRRGIAIDATADEANIVISGNNFFGNNRIAAPDPNAGLHVADIDGTAVTANGNWWGSASGPTLDSHSTADDRDGALDNNDGSLAATNIDVSTYSSTQFTIKPENL